MSNEGWHHTTSNKKKKNTRTPKSTDTTISPVTDTSYSHQDWKPVVLNGNGGQVKRSQIIQNTVAVRKFDSGNSQPVANSAVLKKLEEADGEDGFHIEKISLDLRLQIQQARCTKKMTQKDLAKLCNLPDSVIRDYENGSAVPSGTILATISRILGVKLTNKKR
jgi:putative transcription factor